LYSSIDFRKGALKEMNSLFINKPSDFVVESIEGAVASVPHLKRLDGFPQVTKELFIH